MPPKPVSYKGKEYGSRKELCQEYGIDEKRVTGRLCSGWTLEEAVETALGEKVTNGIQTEYEGVQYPSLSSMAEKLDLPLSILQHAYYRTKDIGQSVEYARGYASRDMAVWGKEYQSLSQVAMVFGISHYHLVSQVREGVRLQEAVKKALETEPVQFQGKTYEHFGDLCAAYRIQPANVYFRLEYGMDLKEALTRPIKGMGNKNETVYRGKTYESQIDLCRSYGISVLCVREQLRSQPLTFLEEFDVLNQMKERLGMGKEEMLNYIPHCRIRGRNYKTMAGLLREFGITASAFYTRKCRNEDKDVFAVLKEMQKETRRAYVVDGKPMLQEELEKMGYTKYRISRLDKGELPKYPRLQGFDLDTGCMDGEKLYYEILNEKLQEAGQVPGEEIEIKME
ncbi:hypothetical protein AALA36_13820 [Lachnospiraceae bacterium 66-29]